MDLAATLSLPPTTYMWVFESSTCALPLEWTGYAATYNVPPDVFERLVHVWRDSISSPESFDRAFSGLPGAALGSLLRNVIVEHLGYRPVVRTVSLRREIGPWKSYKIEVAGHGPSGLVFGVIVSSWLGRFGRTYRISDVGMSRLM